MKIEVATSNPGSRITETRRISNLRSRNGGGGGGGGGGPIGGQRRRRFGKLPTIFSTFFGRVCGKNWCKLGFLFHPPPGGNNNSNNNRNNFGGGSGGGNRNNNKRNNTKLSAEQLDAELDEYRAKAI